MSSSQNYFWPSAPAHIFGRVGWRVDLVHADVLEPQRSTVFAVQPWLAVGEEAGYAAGTAGAVGAVEEGDVLVADVAEPGRVSLNS
jgi:hypothetical protein